MNWVRYYGASSYYGTLLLKDFVDDMRAVDATKPSPPQWSSSRRSGV